MANVLKYVKSAPSFRSSLPFFFATHYPFPRNDKVSSRSLANRLPLEVSPSSSRSAVRLNCHRFRTTCGHQRVPHGSPGPNALWRPVEIRVARHCLTTPILPDFPISFQLALTLYAVDGPEFGVDFGMLAPASFASNVELTPLSDHALFTGHARSQWSALLHFHSRGYERSPQVDYLHGSRNT